MSLDNPAAVDEAAHVLRCIFVAVTHAAGQRIERDSPGWRQSSILDEPIKHRDELVRVGCHGPKIRNFLNHEKRNALALDAMVPAKRNHAALETRNALAGKVDHRALQDGAAGVGG